MDPFRLFERWFWAVCIAFSFVIAGIIRIRAAEHIRQNPELKDGYRKITKGLLTWGNIPWVVMGVGCLVGGIPSVFNYFSPRHGGSFVHAFFASVFFVWALGTYWMFFRGGARMLVRHPGVLGCLGCSCITSAATLKALWLAGLGGGIFAVVTLFVHDPFPPVPSTDIVALASRAESITVYDLQDPGETRYSDQKLHDATKAPFDVSLFRKVAPYARYRTDHTPWKGGSLAIITLSDGTRTELLFGYADPVLKILDSGESFLFDEPAADIYRKAFLEDIVRNRFIPARLEQSGERE